MRLPFWFKRNRAAFILKQGADAFWASENLEAFIALRSSQPANHHGKL